MKILTMKKMLFVMLFAFAAGNVAFADIVIIVNPASGVDSLSASDAKKIFLAKKKKLPNGKKAVLVEQEMGSAVRSNFNSKVLKKSDSQYKAYWSKIIFSGKGSPPKSVTDDAAMKAFVAANADAIGYISSSAADGSVKVVLTVK